MQKITQYFIFSVVFQTKSSKSVAIPNRFFKSLWLLSTVKIIHGFFQMFYPVNLYDPYIYTILILSLNVDLDKSFKYRDKIPVVQTQNMIAFFLLLEILFIQGYLASHSLPYTPTIDKDSITVGGFSSGACFATQVPTYYEIKF